MRKFIYTSLVVLAFIASTPRANAGWFTDNHEHEENQKLRQQLVQQQHTNDGLSIVILVLGVSVVLALVSGTIIGSASKREAKRHVQRGE